MSLTKLDLGGNNDVIHKLLPLRVSDIPAEDGKIEKLFLRSRLVSSTADCIYYPWTSLFYSRLSCLDVSVQQQTELLGRACSTAD
jgi:hypothetical protein